MENKNIKLLALGTVLLAVFIAAAAGNLNHGPNGPKIKKYISTNREARGTAIYIPQIHRSPGTEFEDPINNTAYKTQKEIHKYLTVLKNEYKISFYMGEAGMFGELPNSFVRSIRNSANEREAFLRGALIKLKSESGDSVIVYGSQNRETYEQTLQIVNEKFGSPSTGSGQRKKLNNFSDIPWLSKASAKNSDTNEKLFDEIVVNKRSLEAVDNFVSGMERTNSQKGVLIYGAGHGEQIISGLRNKGFDVIVISPPLVHKKYPAL